MNDEVITYRDLGEYLKSRYLQLKMEGASDAEIKPLMVELENNGVQRLIQDKLLVNETKNKDIKVRKEMVDRRMKEIVHNYPSEEIFLKSLEQDGLTISDIQKKIEDQIKVQQLIDTEIKAKIYVNPNEVTDYYNAHRDEYKRPERIDLDSIFVPKGKDPAAAKTKIEKALDQIKSGKDFRKVAESTSSAPALGTFEKGKLLPQLETSVWSLAAGQISGVIEVDDGFYILKVLGKMPAQTASLEEVKDTIQKIVFNEKFRQKIDEWLGQLEKAAFVEIKNEEPK